MPQNNTPDADRGFREARNLSPDAAREQNRTVVDDEAHQDESDPSIGVGREMPKLRPTAAGNPGGTVDANPDNRNAGYGRS